MRIADTEFRNREHQESTAKLEKLSQRDTLGFNELLTYMSTVKSVKKRAMEALSVAIVMIVVKINCQSATFEVSSR